MNVVSTRKLISGLVLLITGIVIAWYKGDIPTNLNNLMQMLYGAFVMGNAVEHFTNMKSNKEKDKE